MAEQFCCVCHKSVGDDAPSIGKRSYCEEHYAKVGHDRSSVWRSSAVTLIALLIFAVLVIVVALVAKPELEGTALIAVGIGLALVPAAIWMVFFYLQDLLEPEPKRYVILVFVVAALLASAVGMPVIRGLFKVQDWLGYSLLVTLLGSILVIGFVQEFLKYAAVRYSVYMLPEFDERMDGILYGTAAGLGYATMLNIYYVVNSGGVNLEVGIVRIVVTALAQASFAGITGYFLARAKFEDEPVWWLALGLTIAAVLNGLFSVLLGGVTRTRAVLTGEMATPWYGLVLAALFAGAILVVLLALMRRADRMTVSGAQGA
jgi:RsiW-degrading membrane proteinase PrsW (M82 family)